jgi:hypothetical protein
MSKRMQSIHPAAHEREVLGRYRARLVADAAPTDVQNFGLTDNGQIVRTVGHRFALS